MSFDHAEERLQAAMHARDMTPASTAVRGGAMSVLSATHSATR